MKAYNGKGIFTMWLFGHWFSIRDHRSHPQLFSERNGYRKFIHIGPFCIQHGRVRLPSATEMIPMEDSSDE